MTETGGQSEAALRASCAHSCHRQLPRPRVCPLTSKSCARRGGLPATDVPRCICPSTAILSSLSVPLPVRPPRLKTRRPTQTLRPRSQTTSSPPPSPQSGGLTSRPPSTSLNHWPPSPGASNPIGPSFLLSFLLSLFHSTTISSPIIRRP